MNEEHPKPRSAACQAQHEELSRRLNALLAEYPCASFIVSVAFGCGARVGLIFGSRREVAMHVTGVLDDCDFREFPIPPPGGTPS